MSFQTVLRNNFINFNWVPVKTPISPDSQNGFGDLFNRTKALAPKMKLFQEISGERK